MPPELREYPHAKRVFAGKEYRVPEDKGKDFLFRIRGKFGRRGVGPLSYEEFGANFGMLCASFSTFRRCQEWFW